MKKHFLFSALLMVSMGVLFSACQDDEIALKDAAPAEECFMGRIVPDTVSYALPISKVKPYMSVVDSVFIIDGGFAVENIEKYRTIKVCNFNRSIMQEWFLDDLHCKSWFNNNYYYRDGDPNGLAHGYYYPWEGVMSEASELWDYVIVDNKINPEHGFRIPNITDYRNLATIVGGANYVRQILQLKYDGIYRKNGNYFTDLSADLWINPYDPINWSNPSHMDLGRVDGCGILMPWYVNAPDRNGYMPAYTNDPNICAKVRLIRDLTVSTW